MPERKLKLYEGLRVKVWRLMDAGGYDVEKVEMFSTKIKLTLSGGQPFEDAYREAEQLAITIDAEFVLRAGIEGKIIRKSRTGEYK